MIIRFLLCTYFRLFSNRSRVSYVVFLNTTSRRNIYSHLYPLNNQANALVYGANRMVIKEYKRKWEEYKRIQAENSSGSYEPKKIAATSASSTSTTTKNDIEMNMDMTPSPLSNSNTEVVPVSATKKKKHPKMLTKSMQSMEFVARDFSTGAVSGDTPTTTTATTNKSGGDDDEGEDSSA